MYPLVPASGSAGGREQKADDFLSSKRVRANIRAVLDDKDAWLTPAYSLAIQAEHLLQCVEGKRKHVLRVRGKSKRWGRDKRAELLADPRTNAELAVVYGCSPAAISMQRSIGRKEAA